MRFIASKLGLSATTVSLALRNSPLLPRETRERVVNKARELGYIPDPVLTQLMAHLRRKKASNHKANLAMLSTLDAPITRRLAAGAIDRAAELGYALDHLNITPYLGKPARLTTLLCARGVTGLLLAPSADPIDFAKLLDWSRFAAVSMTYSIFAPQVHRVVTHHYENAMRTISILRDRSYKRIGFAMTQDMEIRSNHSYSGAYARSILTCGLPPIPVLLLDESSGGALREWFSTHAPDAVILANANHLEETIKPALPDNMRLPLFVCLDYEPRYPVSGMDQQFEILGSNAVDALVAQLHLNHCGLPTNPTVTMVHGRWCDLPAHTVADEPCRSARALRPKS